MPTDFPPAFLKTGGISHSIPHHFQLGLRVNMTCQNRVENKVKWGPTPTTQKV